MREDSPGQMGALVAKTSPTSPSPRPTSPTSRDTAKVAARSYSHDNIINRAAKHYAKILQKSGEQNIHDTVKAAIAEAQRKAKQESNGADTEMCERAARILTSKARRNRRRQRKREERGERSEEAGVAGEHGEQRPSVMGQITQEQATYAKVYDIKGWQKANTEL